MIENEETIVAWGRETFGDTPAMTLAIRANAEMSELLRAIDASPDSRFARPEIADVVILLVRLCGRLGTTVAAEVAAKMSVNRTRTWEKAPDGSGLLVRTPDDSWRSDPAFPESSPFEFRSYETISAAPPTDPGAVQNAIQALETAAEILRSFDAPLIAHQMILAANRCRNLPATGDAEPTVGGSASAPAGPAGVSGGSADPFGAVSALEAAQVQADKVYRRMTFPQRV